MSVVTAFTPATSSEAAAWFRHKLSFETDCADVYSAMRDGACDFVLLHVVGSPEAFARGAAFTASPDRCRPNERVAS